ncbi:MAG TPA: PAS domain-containing sensor histidine kinase [Rhodocyclaceae bacterium]|nr:PAS domain-containing sensor histidine kinase [Rhodocyclaceae bacterium]
MTTPWRQLAASGVPSESYWRSLHYFHIYRMLVALLFGIALVLPSSLMPFSIQTAPIAEWLVRAYLLAAVGFFVLLRWRPHFNLLLTIEVTVDVAVLTALMHLSGGNRSGISYMLLVVLAGAGLVGQGRLTMFYASLASVAVLLEQGSRLLDGSADLSDFTYTGIICAGYFGTAATAHLLSRRAVASELLAEERGNELAVQLRINEQVIRDMQDGVLVVDGEGRVRQHNRQAEALCHVAGREPIELDDFCHDLARRYPEWRTWGREVETVVTLPGGNRPLHVRYVPAGVGEDSLIYLADTARLQAQAQQLKLAALGRLTANMAHEIRNPLAAISHAGELLQDEQDPALQARLLRIISENTQRLNRLVTDVLELGRRDKTQIETIRLQPFLESFVEELAVADASAAKVLSVECPPAATLLFDRGHLNRLLGNLVGNAVRYCSGVPGSVHIRVEMPAGANTVELHVEDDGPGIEASARIRVFEPFFTTRSTGTGLGLYIARELCEANGAILVLLDGEGGAHFRMAGRKGPEQNGG